MKNILKKVFIVVFALGFLVFGNSALAATPGYVSQSASNLTQNGATLNAAYNPKGLQTSAWFELQSGGEYGYQNLGSVNAGVSFSHTLTNLSANTSYTFRSVAENATGTTYGNWMTFTTTGGNTGGGGGGGCTSNCGGNTNPTVQLSANKTSVYSSEAVVLTWSSTNANYCNSNSNWSNSTNTSGSATVYPTSSRTYSITCVGDGGLANSDSVYISVIQQPVYQNPPTVTLNASPTSVSYGGTTNLNWNVSNATSCTASNGWTGSKNSNGGTQSIGNMTAGTTFSITCTGPGGSASDSVYVSVGSQPQNPPTVTLNASPTSVSYGGTTNLNWNVSNATSCTASNGWTGSKNSNGGTQSIGNMTAGTTFSITCTGPGGSASDSVYVSVASQPITNPTVITNSPSAISTNSAILNGTVSANGGSNVNAWFEWGPNTSMTNQTNQLNYGSANNTNYSHSLGGLQANTTYYYRAVAQNANGQSVYGNTLSFTTQTGNISNNNPSVTTYLPSEINQNSAILNGYVATNGNFTIRWFEYGTSSGFLPTQTNKINQGTNSGNFNQIITNLTPNTTYYFRAVAEGNGQTVYGNVLNFVTTGNINNNTCNFGNCAPTAVTTLATNVDQNSARLNGLGLINGNVNTNGYFEYGETQSLGRTTTTGFIGNSSSSPFFSSLFGLTPNTTYYFRAVVTNQYGISRGDIQTFRTRSAGIVSGVNTTNTTNTITRYVYREVVPVVNTISTTNITEGVGLSKSSLVFLTINRNHEIVNIDNTIDYTINYKNVSSEHLKDLVLRVVLPHEYTFVNTTRGYLGDDINTIVVNIDTLYPQEEGSVVVRIRVNTDATIGKTVVTTANMVYTISRNNLQEEVFAYSKNEIGSRYTNNTQLVGGALFGNGFLPTTLIGWLLLILIILLIILAIRMTYTRIMRRTN